jgi:hypothetical protein
VSLIVKEPEKKKAASWAKYTWVKDDNGRFVLVVGVDTFYIWEQAGYWYATAHIDGQSYHAERPTLEEAAKAADRLLYKKLPKAWTVTDARGIISPWKGDLNLCQ